MEILAAGICRGGREVESHAWSSLIYAMIEIIAVV